MSRNDSHLPNKEDKDSSTEGKNKTVGRRQVLRTSALGLATLAVPSTSAVAKSGDDSNSIPDRILGPDVENVSELPSTQATMEAMSTPPVEGVYELTKEDGGVEFLVVGGGVRPVEYDLRIDPDEFWYEVDAVEEPQQSDGTTTTDDISTNAFSTYTVQITQHDPAEVKLCRTKQKLKWNHNGSSVTFRGRNMNGTRAWNPTGAGTNWYKIYDRWNQWRYLNNGRAITSPNYAKFYNTDFPGCGRTEVYHVLTLEAYKNGGVNHYTTINRSGCAHELLHSHTRVV